MTDTRTSCTCGGPTYQLRDERTYGRFDDNHQWERHGTLSDTVLPERYCPACDMIIIDASRHRAGATTIPR